MRQNYDLLDIYRIYHKSKTLFSYRNPRGATRTDRMYLTNQHKHYIKKFEYVPTMATDHLLSPVVTINLPIKIKWSSGLYCLNNSVISNIQFKTEIENFWQIWTQAKSNFETILEWWYMGKCLLRDLCKSFSIEIQKTQKYDFNRNKIELENLIATKNQNITHGKMIIELKQKIDNYYLQKCDGSKIRSRITKIENEKPIKTFFELENSRANDQNITQLKSETNPNIILESKSDILNVIETYYKNLWSRNYPEIDETIQDTYIENINSVKIDEPEAIDLEHLISEEEVATAIDQLNNDSSPGSDGLTSNFYKTFKYLLIKDLTEMLNNCFFKNEMSESMKDAVIKLIFKKNDMLLLKNWRPISLLNTDYKILSKTLANRITPLLSKIILPNQKCGLPKRRIEQLLCNIQAVFEIAKKMKNLD